MRHEARLSDQSPVPLSWVVGSLTLSGSALVVCIGAAFSFGSALTKNSEGQMAINQRVQKIEEDRSYRIREFDTLSRANLERLTAIETKVDLLLKRQK